VHRRLRPGWRDAVAQSRAEFERKQLSAAIHRQQDEAAEALNACGWTVTKS
jgi:hypothetical protein